MNIREIKLEDNVQISKVIRKVIVELKAPKTGTTFADPELDHLSIAYKGNRSIYFIIENNDKILGGAGINPLRDSDELICELQKMYFTENARGKGWGEKMIDKCLTYAIDKGYKFCYIETMDFMKAAQKLYLKKGFDFIGKPMGNTGHTNCNVWMIKKLK
jgi:putative acetyltransferase